MSGRVLVVRLDNVGDVLLAGPAVRAVAAGAEEVVMLAGPRGRTAADMLPCVDRVVEWCAPWIDPEPHPVNHADMADFVERIKDLAPDAAVVFTSFHQSALPLALLLRMAGVEWIGAISDEYPGSLLDLRHRIERNLPEPERALSLARASGFELPAGDNGRLAIQRPLPEVRTLVGPGRYIVVHPGASVPAREWPAERCADAVRALTEAGERVVVTGLPEEKELTASVAGTVATDLGGQTDLPELAAVLDEAEMAIVPNTGPAHLSAAVGTPVVSLFAPVVSAERWAPYGVPTVLLGDQHAPCRGTRARVCPVPGHPCLSHIGAREILCAVESIQEGAA